MIRVEVDSVGRAVRRWARLAARAAGRGWSMKPNRSVTWLKSSCCSPKRSNEIRSVSGTCGVVVVSTVTITTCWWIAWIRSTASRSARGVESRLALRKTGTPGERARSAGGGGASSRRIRRAADPPPRWGARPRPRRRAGPTWRGPGGPGEGDASGNQPPWRIFVRLAARNGRSTTRKRARARRPEAERLAPQRADHEEEQQRVDQQRAGDRDAVRGREARSTRRSRARARRRRPAAPS